MVGRIYSPELQLNKLNASDAEAPFLDLHFFYFKWSGSSKIFDKRDDFDFDMIVNFHFYDDACNKILMLNFINRAIGSKNFEKTCFFFVVFFFFNFYCRHYELVSKL